MRFSILIVALSCSLLALASPAPPRFDLVARGSTDAPICSNTTGPMILLISGASTYALHLGADKQNYTLIGPDEIVGCVGPLTSKYSQCLPCNFPVNKIQPNVEAGTCVFRVSGHQDLLCHQANTTPLVLRSPGQILDVRCGLDACPSASPCPEHNNTLSASDTLSHQVRNSDPNSRTRNAKSTDSTEFVEARNVFARASPKCEATRDGHYLTLASGHKSSLIYLPADRKTHVVSGDQAEYGCTTADHANCGPCDQKYDVIHVGEGMEACYLTTTGSSQILEVTAKNSPEVFKNGLQGIETVACTAKTAGESVSLRKWEAPSVQARADEFIVAPASSDPNCPASATWNTLINTISGRFFAPVPLDLMAHPASEMHCLHDTDSEQAACVPCNEIGIATSVATTANWGPCIFFTEDRRNFETPYWSEMNASRLAPITTLNPGGIISMIECGTGAK